MKFSKEMYPKIALIKSAYSFTDRAYVHLDCDGDYYYVDLRTKPGEAEIDEGEFMNEMMCQCVRHEVYCQTRSLREMLIARAMASTVVRDTTQNHRDVGGFPRDVPNRPHVAAEPVEDAPQQFNADEVLQDWFSANENA